MCMLKIMVGRQMFCKVLVGRRVKKFGNHWLIVCITLNWSLSILSLN